MPKCALEVLPNRIRHWTVVAAVKLETWRNKLSETAQELLPFYSSQGLIARASVLPMSVPIALTDQPVSLSRACSGLGTRRKTAGLET